MDCANRTRSRRSSIHLLMASSSILATITMMGNIMIHHHYNLILIAAIIAALAEANPQPRSRLPLLTGATCFPNTGLAPNTYTLFGAPIPSRNRNDRCFLNNMNMNNLNSLLQVRGGDDGFVDDDDDDDDASAEDLLDSLFSFDDDDDDGETLPPKQSISSSGTRPGPRPAAAASNHNVKPKAKKLHDHDDAKSEQSMEGMTTNANRRSSRFDDNDNAPASSRGNANNKIDTRSSTRFNYSKTEQGDNNSNHSKSNRATKKHVHAMWGPNASKHPGPPPSRATPDELRTHQHAQNLQNSRKQLLSSLALDLHDTRVNAVQELIKGSAAHVPPELFGETIAQERSACDEMFRETLEGEMGRRKRRILMEELERSENRYTNTTTTMGDGGDGDDDDVTGDDDDPFSMRGELLEEEPSFRHIEDPTLLSYWGLTPNAKLYGGAQYHRVLRYYHHLFLTVPLPPITDDEVALLTNGVTEVHDASDLMRAVALLVQHKMERVMEDVLQDMTRRLLYVMDRQWEMVDYSMTLHRRLGKNGGGAFNEAKLYRKHGSADYTAAEEELKHVLSAGYHKFAEERASEAHDKSLEDVRSLLRYITWDMGRARKRVGGGANNRQGGSQGFISQVEIVSGDIDPSADNKNDRARRQNDGMEGVSPQGNEKSNTTSKKKKRRRGNKKNAGMSPSSDHSNRMVARGGGSVGSRGRNKRSKRHYQEEEELDEGDLVGGVMNRGDADDDDDDMPVDSNGSNRSTTSLMVPSSKSSPIFSGGDDQVLNVLLDTVSSTMVPKSDTQASHTQAAIESLVRYVTDRMRNDLSRIVRSKFNSFFLLAFYDDLGVYLRRELDGYLDRQGLD